MFIKGYLLNVLDDPFDTPHFGIIGDLITLTQIPECTLRF